MRIYYWHDEVRPNFGDELNRMLWPRLTPKDLWSDEDYVFAGIGTLLGIPEIPQEKVVIFGAGAGYGKVPDNHRWKIFFVRGPKTANLLKLGKSQAISDPGLLVARLWPLHSSRFGIGFMPHVSNANAAWEQVCARAGIHYIDPCWEVPVVLDKISKLHGLIAEAMHGAIVADAMRVPWCPVVTRQNVNRFKWEDWTLSVNLTYKPLGLPTLWAGRGKQGVSVGRFWRLSKKFAACKALQIFASRQFRSRFVLSDDQVLAARTNAMMNQIERLQEWYFSRILHRS